MLLKLWSHSVTYCLCQILDAKPCLHFGRKFVRLSCERVARTGTGGLGEACCYLQHLQMARSYWCNRLERVWVSRLSVLWNDHGWRKRKGSYIEERGPTYAARSLPQYNSAFATRVLQSTCVCVKGERACARIFKLFRTPGINSTELVDWFRVCSFVGYSSLHMQAEMIPGKFLHSLKV
jgi:hypothetical protein